ncbi:MAG: hypothetical protein LM601_03365 [Candidatus Verstraetearchaeota archaeon]|uniref:hypothetical protein n=1 Tax=Candidatus Culexarchaeum yellowstonense TaxID=2928963 RepID=UPI0026EBCC39|nr:hypothetical protein [Candidatus Culexarchaeum yellowstonense]MCC6018037.1 hypothetical protein [Candidatus Verstraetearchaeota archaeon]
MKKKTLYLLTIISIIMLTIKVAYATEILSIGEFIDHISGYLEKPGDKEPHNVYKWGTGPGATTIEIVNFYWDDPNTALIIHLIFECGSGSTSEVWAGGHVYYRILQPTPPYTTITQIIVEYGWYYGGEATTPSVAYWGQCNCYGYDQI